MTKGDLGGDLLLSGLGLLGLIVVLFFVFAGLSPREPSSSEAPVVGETILVTHVARRRTVGTLVWNDLATGRSVFEGDAVFVGPGSATTIRLSDGSKLDIDENTLVVVTATQGDTTVDVKEGSVGGEGPMVVRGVGGSVVFSDGARGRVRIDPTGGTLIELSEGTADLTTASGDARRLAAGQAIEVDDEGMGDLVRMDIQLTAPVAGNVVYVSTARAQVDFAWTAPESDDAYRFELARNPRFSRIPHTHRTAQSTVTQGDLEPGVYYWRVLRGNSISETRRLTILRDDPPVLYRPRTDQEYSKDEAPAVAWTRIGGVRDYELRVEKRYGGDVASTVVEGQTWHRLSLEPGAWCAQVRTQRDGRAGAPWSAKRCFLVVKDERLPPPNLHEATLEKDGH